MTVKATIDSTLNGQSADLILIEDAPDGARQYETKSLSGGSENLFFTGLDGGSDKEYTAKIVPSTSDVTQTSEVNFGATVEIDPLPHRPADANNRIRETAEFNNGVTTKELGLGDHPLIGGLLTTALKNGEVLADDGYVYASVQAAQDAADSWIFIGPGTFNESVTIDTASLSVIGSGYNTHISPSSGDAILVQVSDVTVSNVSVTGGTPGNGNPDNGIEVASGGDKSTMVNVHIRDADQHGFDIYGGNDHKVISCIVNSADDLGVILSSSRCIISNSTFSNVLRAMATGSNDYDDNIFANNVGYSLADYGVRINPSDDDNIIIGNRFLGDPGNNSGIRIRGDNCIIANNRISGWSTGINDEGSGTVLDANNTGASN